MRHDRSLDLGRACISTIDVTPASRGPLSEPRLGIPVPSGFVARVWSLYVSMLARFGLSLLLGLGLVFFGLCLVCVVLACLRACVLASGWFRVVRTPGLVLDGVDGVLVATCFGFVV
jgi:hypothetical protein